MLIAGWLAAWQTGGMGWLDKIMFWRKRNHEAVVEQVEGFTVDGCFTLPDARLPDIAPVERNDDSC